MSRVLLSLVVLLALLGCREEPRRIENENLGIAVTFPGPPKLHRHTDPGPFGDVEWFDLAMSPAGRLDETFSVAVGNLPPGNKGGTTPREILTTFQNFLGYRFGPVQRTELPTDKGPGFRYKPQWSPDAKKIVTTEFLEADHDGQATNEFGDEITFTPAGQDGQRTLGTIQFELVNGTRPPS